MYASHHIPDQVFFAIPAGVIIGYKRILYSEDPSSTTSTTKKQKHHLFLGQEGPGQIK